MILMTSLRKIIKPIKSLVQIKAIFDRQTQERQYVRSLFWLRGQAASQE